MLPAALRNAAAALSLVVPGVGQLLRGRVLDAALFAWLALWLHALAMGTIRAKLGDTDVLDAFVWGAAGVPGATAIPATVVLTVVAVAVHVAAAVDARRPPRDPRGRGEMSPKRVGEAPQGAASPG